MCLLLKRESGRPAHGQSRRARNGKSGLGCQTVQGTERVFIASPIGNGAPLPVVVPSWPFTWRTSGYLTSRSQPSNLCSLGTRAASLGTWNVGS